MWILSPNLANFSPKPFGHVYWKYFLIPRNVKKLKSLSLFFKILTIMSDVSIADLIPFRTKKCIEQSLLFSEFSRLKREEKLERRGEMNFYFGSLQALSCHPRPLLHWNKAFSILEKKVENYVENDSLKS